MPKKAALMILDACTQGRLVLRYISHSRSLGYTRALNCYLQSSSGIFVPVGHRDDRVDIALPVLEKVSWKHIQGNTPKTLEEYGHDFERSLPDGTAAQVVTDITCQLCVVTRIVVEPVTGRCQAHFEEV